MKKVLTFALVCVTFVATSCGVSTKAPKDNKDTAAYAIGVVIGQNAMMRLDSTMDYKILVEAVKDAYSKNADAKMKEMQAYMMGVQIGQSARQVDSTFDLDVIAAGIADVFAKKQAIKAEEADGYIMGYIAAKQNVANEEYFNTIDAIDGVQKTETGLRYKISTPGSEPKATAVDTVMVHYTLYGKKDEVLDSSVSRNEALKAAPGGVVPGFAQGMQLLGKGGKATIWVPSELGYGDRGQGSIEPNQPLKFEIEVVDILSPVEAKK